jgi:hypothetical protein
METEILRAARDYLSRGWNPTPVARRGKKPLLEGWPNCRLTEAELPLHFSNGNNLGVKLGNGLVDIDADLPEALALVGWLPPTDSAFGHAAKPNSHHLFISEPVSATRQYKTPGGKMIVELRSIGCQTVVPPSVHPSGEPIRWYSEGEPAHVDAATLQRAVSRLAAGALLAHHWPVEGSRHNAALALAGALLRSSWQEADVREFVVGVARAAGDDEIEDRDKAVSTTAKRLRAGEKATGWPGVVSIFGKDIVDRVCEWLGIEHGNPGATRDPYADLGEDFGRRRPRPADRPAFPLDALGVPWLQAFITHAARALSCPVDFVAGAVLGAASAALAGAVRVHIMNRFYASGALWIVLVGPPGSGKGPAYELATITLQEIQRQRYRDYVKERETFAAEMDRWEALPKKERGQRPTPPVYRPVTTDDATIEALAVVLAGNQRGLGLLNEEAAGWLRGMGQYKRSGGNDQEHWLRIFDSRPIELLRKTDGPNRIERPVVPILSTTQPERIAGLLRWNENGLRERISCVYPADAGMQPLEEHPPLADMGLFRGLIAGLLAIGLDEHGQPRQSKLTREARRLWTEQEEILCAATRAPAFNPASLSAYSKGRGMAGRLSCLLPALRHVAACAPPLEPGSELPEEIATRIGETLPDEVAAPLIQNAWQITAYFLDHNEAVFREHGAGAARINRAVRWLEQHSGEASLRELARSEIAGDQSASAARDLARALEDHGLARLELRAKGGARASTHVVLAKLEDGR